MRQLLPVLALVAAPIVVAPAGAQDNVVTLGHFTTVMPENAPDFEEAAREHARWHTDQNDPQAWPAYQAMTGRGEYAFLSSGMTWANLDSPVLDPAADLEHWANSAAPYAEAIESTLWVTLPGGNPPADPTQYPVVQVFEFEVKDGGMPAVMEGIDKYSEAVREAAPNLNFAWSQVVSADAPAAVFIAVWAESFAALGGPAPGPEVVMTNAYGPAQANRMMTAFNEAATMTANMIWIYRPDLSHIPGG
jgi:hypothetical protein